MRPPFKQLPSFLVAALALSYLGYKDEIGDLLNLLCHNTKKWFVAHNGLKGHLVTWDITSELDIGPKSRFTFNYRWPTQKQLCMLPRYQEIKLCAIRYRKNVVTSNLSAI